MALEVLQLKTGDPQGESKYRDYAFQRATVSGDEEAAIRREAECWVLVCDREEVRDHDEYGKDSWSTLHTETPFLETPSFSCPRAIPWERSNTSFGRNPPLARTPPNTRNGA